MGHFRSLGCLCSQSRSACETLGIALFLMTGVLLLLLSCLLSYLSYRFLWNTGKFSSCFFACSVMPYVLLKVSARLFDLICFKLDYVFNVLVLFSPTSE